jgi:hypothetical protein
MYWAVTLGSGQGMAIFKDGVEKKWYRQGGEERRGTGLLPG